ncbi:hypothetical protein [Actinokineospora enzanensis]|uniref:hypothetical protein n=1 Tax=Actinokineospora enzanensis TaxID=155975 RepID=UPI00037C10AF|nr:hypothetical protein [Actinokineospora enzanensis]
MTGYLTRGAVAAALTLMMAGTAWADVAPGTYSLRSVSRAGCVGNSMAPVSLVACGSSDSAWIVDADGAPGYTIGYDGQCLTSDDGRVWIDSCTGMRNQAFDIRSVGDGLAIVNTSGKLLTAATDRVTAAASGVSGQVWALVPLGA